MRLEDLEEIIIPRLKKNLPMHIHIILCTTAEVASRIF